MRIDPKVPATSLDTKSQSAKPSEPPTNTSQTPVASGASVVVLSPAATTFPQTATAAIAARLEKIRELLHNGQYPIDLDLLASRIVDDEALRSRKPS